MLIRERLDAAFATEPPDVPVEQRLAAGRAALRRRRAGQCVAAVAVVAVISVGSVALGGTQGDSGQRFAPATGAATSPSASPSTHGSPTVEPTAWPYPGQQAYVDANGRLDLARGVTLIRQVSAPAKPPDDRAIQVAVRSRGDVWWLAMTWKQGDDATAYTVVGPFDGFQQRRFHDWVLQQSYRAGFADPTSTANASGNSSGPAISADEQLVRFEPDGTLVAEAGYVIWQQRPDPGFTGFTGDGQVVAVAEVRDDLTGARWFVLARDNGDGTTQNISARPGVGPVPGDLDGFIAWARHKYDSGEGLL